MPAGSASAGTTTGHDVKAVLAGEIQIALVMAGAAEDRAGAVIHQHEVGDIERQKPVRIAERMARFDAGVVALLFGLLDVPGAGARAPALLDETPQLGSRSASARASGWSADMAQNDAPKRVSWRVVKSSMRLIADAVRHVGQLEPHAHALGAPDPVAPA